MSTNTLNNILDSINDKSQQKSQPKQFDAKRFLTGPDQYDLIGNGSFAKVRRCYHEKLNTVVVKYFTLDGSQESIDKKLEDAAKEAVTLVNINHLNIVKVYGITSWSIYCGIIMEEVTGGTLEDLLFKKTEYSIAWPLCLNLCVEIADALSYLHNQNPPFVHCDMKPQNVLLTNDLTVKLADFGAVTVVQATQTTSSFQNLSNNQFTSLYCAPEILSNVHKPKCSCDMYSYAMIVYEIITRRQVFMSSGVNLNLIMYHIIHNDLKPNMEFVDEIESYLISKCNDISIFMNLKSVMINCWNTDPSKRLTAPVVLDELQTLMVSTSTSKDTVHTVQHRFSHQKKMFDKGKLLPLNDCTLSTNEVLPTSYNILDYLSLHLEITYKVIRSFSNKAVPQKAILKNAGYQCIPSGNNNNWAIYLSSSNFSITQGNNAGYSYLSDTLNFKLSHIDGTLYKLAPTDKFRGLKPNESVDIYFNAYSVVSRYSIFPRWYVCVPGEQPQIIKSTNEDDEFGIVSNFDVLMDYQSSVYDFTPAKRFSEYNIADLGYAPMRIIPKTMFTKLILTDFITVDNKMCFRFSNSDVFENEQLFTKRLDAIIPTKNIEAPFQSCAINFREANVTDVRQCNEAHQITIDSKTNSIDIIAHGQPGAFYATQTLIALAETQGEALKFPTGVIKDAPRYDYRGLMIDTVSNFIQVDDLLLIIKVMAMYKLNKLVLQLSNNEGWRIEIDGLPELTEVGAIRRHTENEDAVFPALGSGPYGNTSGSGYYTIDQYKKILKFALNHCIEVIPMICMPGQCNAAILSMKTRFNKMKNVDKAKAEKFLLNELNEKPSSDSLYKYHIMNPTMESTYHFIDHIIEALKTMHKNIQPLTILYIGGYGLFADKWADSKLFESFKLRNSILTDITSFHEYFLYRVTQLCWNKYGIKLGLHANAALKGTNEKLFQETILSTESVIVYANNTGKKQSTLERGYKLANAGFKVVLSHGSYLFLDHLQEPDPNEIGESWATNYIDDKMVFSFKPDNMYRSINTNQTFQPGHADLLGYTPLNNPQNIIGVQACLYTRLLRNARMIHSQLFPRLLAFAERSWHKAEWEDNSCSQSKQLQSKDWESFANRVGYKEITRLNNLGINYRIPPPGISKKAPKVLLCTIYPGFQFLYRQYNDDKPSEWMKCKSNEFSINKNWEYDFVAVDLKGRRSRCIKLEKEIENIVLFSALKSGKNFCGFCFIISLFKSLNTGFFLKRI